MLRTAGLQYRPGRIITAIVDYDNFVVDIPCKLATEFIEQRRNAFRFIKYRDDNR